MKIRVLQLAASDYSSPPETNLYEQITRALPKPEYEVTHAFLKAGKGGGGGRAGSEAGQVKRFGFSDRQRTGLRGQATRLLQQFCEEQRFDVVIGHGYRPVAMLLAVNRRLKFKRCIGVAHSIGGYDRLYRKAMVKWLAGANCRFVGVSRVVTAYLLSLGSGFTAGNTVTIDNAIDTRAVQRRFIERQQARAALRLPAHGFIFGAIGRLAPVKDPLTLIKAFHRISAGYPHACLAIIGEGALEAECRQLLARLGLAGRVYLLGAVEAASLYLKAYDVFVLPSLNEGFSLALSEAMAASLPIIGSDAPIIEERIASIGEVFPRGNAEALASAMQRHLDLDKQALAKAGSKALQHLLKRHSVEDFRAQYRELVEAWRHG